MRRWPVGAGVLAALAVGGLVFARYVVSVLDGDPAASKAEAARRHAEFLRQLEQPKPAGQPVAVEAPAAELSSYAQNQVELAQAYIDKALEHNRLATEAARSRDIATSCQEFRSADSSAAAAFTSIRPVQDELREKRPDVMATILSAGQRFGAQLGAALAQCRRLGAGS